MSREIAVVPHTHWDREWYRPFQTFRMKLVDLLDELLPLLEGDPSYTHFQLDGQMAVVDDYLEIRPEATATLRRLATAGRLSMGPWYALPDEFLVSGETLVRNLQLGLDRASSFGGAMEVGYLPDMFGHVAQMPQIFRQLGFEHAVVWRGVPAAIDHDAFWWSAPDGSTVRAEYLPQGYGNGAHLPDDAKDLVDRIRQFEQDYGALLDGPILWMNGTDHLMPQAWLGRVVHDANALQDDYHLTITSLAGYLAEAPTDGLPTWKGELRSGARANLLMGVTSNRTDVRQAAARAERAVERLAEPLSALFLSADGWPENYLAHVWLELSRNSAHDSVCACSADEVCDAVLVRYREVTEIADGLTDRAVEEFGRQMASAGAVVLNPSARARSGVVELRLAGEGEIDGMQLVSQRPTSMSLPVKRSEAPQMVQAMLDHQGGFHDAVVGETDDGALEVTLHRDPSRPERIASGTVLDQMRGLGNDDPDSPARINVVRPPVRRMLAYVEAVAGYGWHRWNADALGIEPVKANDKVLANGSLTIEIDDDGTWAVNGQAGFGRLVDDGDSGDTYNYNQPAGDVVVDRPDLVEVELIEAGPLRARTAIRSTYTWPERVESDKRTGERTVVVTTTLELRAGDDLLRCRITFDNDCRDHRLRVWFPVPETTDSSRAECAFAVVQRGLVAEGGPTELGLATYPSRRFVQAGGLTVLHDGLLEYELVDLDDPTRPTSAGALALTIIRCTGRLSQGPMRYRPLPAGPMTPIEGPQLRGLIEASFAIHVGDRDPYALADEFLVPLIVTEAPGGGDRGDHGCALDVAGAEVSSVQRIDSNLVVRVFNPTDEPAIVDLPGRQGWELDLRGRAVQPFEGRLDLGPHRIATLQITA